MNKRDIILLGVGFLAGYVVIKATRSNQVVAPKSQVLPATASQSQASEKTGAMSGTTKIEEPEVVEVKEDPRITACKDKWIRFAETQRFGSEEQMQKTYDNFMTSCVGQS
jgi:hypothetical protein